MDSIYCVDRNLFKKNNQSVWFFGVAANSFYWRNSCIDVSLSKQGLIITFYFSSVFLTLYHERLTGALLIIFNLQFLLKLSTTLKLSHFNPLFVFHTVVNFGGKATKIKILLYNDENCIFKWQFIQFNHKTCTYKNNAFWVFLLCFCLLC